MESKNINQINYGFVILHYVVYDMTAECVDQLLHMFGDFNIHIAVVDNASGNGSGQKLEKRYHDDDRIIVIMNEENLGFAKGNNIGYQYLIERYNLDYIIVMNNDVLIEQKEFLNLIDEIYKENPFDVLGPDIYSTRAEMHQNPDKDTGFTKEILLANYESQSHYLKHAAYYYYRHRTLGKIKRLFIKDPPKVVTRPDYTKPSETAVLHGACYIFSRDYVNARQYCFNPATFLYMEEDILHFECKRDGLRMHYDPRITVNHLEDISTNAVVKGQFKRQTVKQRQVLKSTEILIKLMDESVV